VQAAGTRAKEDILSQNDTLAKAHAFGKELAADNK
jgi:hypothetical protein